MVEFMLKMAESDGAGSNFAALTASARDELVKARQTIARPRPRAPPQPREDMAKDLDRARIRL